MHRYLVLIVIMISFPSIILSQDLNIHKYDGNIYSISLSDIDSISFTYGVPCSGLPTITYAGKTYNTVQIGDQCWLKENLNVGTKINSTAGGFQQKDNNIIEKYCYDNDETNCDKYGGLYEWTEAMQYVTTDGAKGICPEGWHIPTYAEIKKLINEVEEEGNGLKAIGEGNGGGAGTNTSGFSGLLAGYRSSYDGSFNWLRYYSGFWISIEDYNIKDNIELGGNMTLDGNSPKVNFSSFGSPKDYGNSVRCIKD